MWNADIVPSARQTSLAREAIFELKSKLQAIEASAELLRKTIQEKESWLAPIRRVPADILSLVFVEFCSISKQHAWKGPLVLGAVCRRWREILIGTPRAWSLIQISPQDHPFNHCLLDIWLSRCGIIKCDFSFHPTSSPEAVKTICDHEKNIRCLSMFNNTKQLARKFSQLEELRLGLASQQDGSLRIISSTTASLNRQSEITKSNLSSGSSRKRSLLDVKRYPKLHTLHLHGPPRVIQNYIALEPGFPPLQELHIHMGYNASAEIVRLAAPTLTKLGLRICWYSERIANKEPITLPRLVHLSYSYEGSSSFLMTEVPELITPVLERYEEFDNVLGHGLHNNTSSVTDLYIRSDRVIEWARFPRLTRLTVQKVPEFFTADCARLKDNPRHCPDLAHILLIHTTIQVVLAEARQHLNDRGHSTGKMIAFEMKLAYLCEDRPSYDRVRALFCLSEWIELAD
jgi:hypothetical protein